MKSGNLFPAKAALLLLLLAIVLAPAAAASRAQSSAPAWQAKVAPQLLQTVQADGEAEFVVFLREQADLSAASALEGKAEKGALVQRLLAETAQQSQAPLLRRLAAIGAEFRSYWIANMIWVRGDEAVLRLVATDPAVARVYANPARQFEGPVDEIALQPLVPYAIEPNIEKINAPQLWAQGYTGQGVVIGGQDTGYDWDHPALINQYRGWNGGSADHNYHWHDAVHSGGGVCGADSSEPCDDHGHGTHTMGTMVGDDGASNQIGVAPGAKWIGCRNMDQGTGSLITYSECFQWFVAPTDINDENPDPAMAPHVVNNSWACPPAEVGCDEADVLLAVVQNVRAAGIVVVSSAGNSGPGCSSVGYPPAIYDASFSVGATTIDDAIAGFSSRGPVLVDGSNRLKPDVVAPGVSIRSSQPGGSYGNSSGTSMAAPHVSGLVALLISAEPLLAGHVDLLEQLLTASATPLTSVQECGGVSGDAIPNNTFGYGRVDALQALQRLQSLQWLFIPFITDAPLT